MRGAVVDSPEQAYWHARCHRCAAPALGIFWEPRWNEWAAGKHDAQALNLTYFYLHFPDHRLFGMWAYYYRRSRYTFIRDSFLASGAIALVIIYYLWSGRPPRELPNLALCNDLERLYIHGFIDTMKQYPGYAYDSAVHASLREPGYAAMPSLHFGWESAARHRDHRLPAPRDGRGLLHANRAAAAFARSWRLR